MNTIEKAKTYNLTVVALDGNEQAEGLAAADIAKVVNISKEEDTIECIKQEQVDFVLTVPIGRYLKLVSYASVRYPLPSSEVDQPGQLSLFLHPFSPSCNVHICSPASLSDASCSADMSRSPSP